MKSVALIAIIAVSQLAYARNNADTEVIAGSSPVYKGSFTPTPSEVLGEMLKMAQVRPYDYLIDLSAGDSETVLAAVKKYGARGLGVVDTSAGQRDFNNHADKTNFSTEQAAFVHSNLSDTNIRNATVLTMRAQSSVSLPLRYRLLMELRPGTRVVSHNVDMGEWHPDRKMQIASGNGHQIYYWIIPAKVQGIWTIGDRRRGETMQLMLIQKFQNITGAACIHGRNVPLQDARLDGDRISFSVMGKMNGQETLQRFRGRVRGNTIIGSMAGGVSKIVNWRAARM